MRLTKRQLKRVIREEYTKLQRRGLLNESYPMHMEKANVCCLMAPNMLINMCAEICEANVSNAMACLQLCACAEKGDAMGCCNCLDAICQCPQCMDICTRHCGC